MSFRVESILTPNTLIVTPRWSWNDYVGSVIQIKGLGVTHDDETRDFVITKLRNLILNKDVELKNPSNPVKLAEDSYSITVGVYLNGVDIAVYFPELRSVA